MTVREIFLENLEFEMSKKNITYYKLSKDTKIPHTTFSGWKNRDSTPKIDKLVEVCRYLDVSADKLLGLQKKEDNISEKDSLKLNDDEFFLIECYRQTNNKGRDTLMSIAEFMESEKNAKLSNSPPDKVPAKIC